MNLIKLKVTEAFNQRYENLGPFDDDWQELCIAASLRALVHAFREDYEIDDDCEDDWVISVKDIVTLCDFYLDSEFVRVS